MYKLHLLFHIAPSTNYFWDWPSQSISLDFESTKVRQKMVSKMLRLKLKHILIFYDTHPINWFQLLTDLGIEPVNLLS